MKNLKLKKELLGTSVNLGDIHFILSEEISNEDLKKIIDLPSLAYLFEETQQKSKDKKVKGNE